MINIPWHVQGVVALWLLFLVACTGAPGNEPGAAKEVDTAVPTAATAAEAEDAEATATTAATEEAAQGAAQKAEEEDRILTGDTRSDQLRRLTASWNTNWERHTIAYDELLSGGPPRDGIPSIDDPQFIRPEEAEEWLAADEPVIALEINGDARAYPLQILTWHEIANDTVGDVPVIVTFCPLCNAAVTFDRRVDGDVFEFGVSGLLRNSDLVMYDRTTETLWQQFTGKGIVGDLAGESLTFVPSSIVSFSDFREAYPDGVVLSRNTGYNRRYGQNPYVGYDTIGQNPFLFRGPIDERLPAMARVVTVSLDGADVAYPYTVLAEEGVVNDVVAGRDLVVFYSSGTTSALGAADIASAEDVGATGVFDPNLNGQKLTFKAEGDKIFDEESGSEWHVTGQAVAGPLAGESLEPIVHGDHFWFSWAAFKPDTIIYLTE